MERTLGLLPSLHTLYYKLNTLYIITMVTSVVLIAVIPYKLFIKYLQICRKYLISVVMVTVDDIIVGGEEEDI